LASDNKKCMPMQHDDDFNKPAINSDNESATFIDNKTFLKRRDVGSDNETSNEKDKEIPDDEKKQFGFYK